MTLTYFIVILVLKLLIQSSMWNWIKLQIGLVSTNFLSMPQKINLFFSDQKIKDLYKIYIFPSTMRILKQEKNVTFLGIAVDEFLT